MHQSVRNPLSESELSLPGEKFWWKPYPLHCPLQHTPHIWHLEGGYPVSGYTLWPSSWPLWWGLGGQQVGGEKPKKVMGLATPPVSSTGDVGHDLMGVARGKWWSGWTGAMSVGCGVIKAISVDIEWSVFRSVSYRVTRVQELWSGLGSEVWTLERSGSRSVDYRVIRDLILNYWSFIQTRSHAAA